MLLPHGVFSFLFLFVVEKVFASSIAEANLIKHLFQNYNPWARPVTSFNSTLILNYRASLYQLVGFETKSETIKTLMWQTLCWQDAVLTWSPDDYEGVNILRVPQEEIWTPDLLPYNDVGVFDSTKYRLVVPLYVYPDGEVCWSAPVTMETTCKMDVKKFPFDSQTCKITIGSWQYTANEVDIFCSQPELIVDSYVSHTQWELKRTSCIRTVDEYTSGTYSAIHFYLEYQRLPGFYVRNLLLPNAVLLALSSLIFFLPCEGGERVGFGITVTLALCVNLVIVIEFIPETSKTIPDVCNYFLVSICLSGCSLLMAAVILNVYKYSWEPDTRKTAPNVGTTMADIRNFVAKLIKTNKIFDDPPAKVLKVNTCGVSKEDEVSKTADNFPVEVISPTSIDVNARVKRIDKLIGVVYFVATSLYTTVFMAEMAAKAE